MCFVPTDSVQVLTLDPSNMKALFRRGSCHLATNNLTSAASDLKAAAAMDPLDKAVQSQLALLHLKELQGEKAQKKFYSGMFANMQRESEQNENAQK